MAPAANNNGHMHNLQDFQWPVNTVPPKQPNPRRTSSQVQFKIKSWEQMPSYTSVTHQQPCPASLLSTTVIHRPAPMAQVSHKFATASHAPRPRSCKTDKEGNFGATLVALRIYNSDSARESDRSNASWLPVGRIRKALRCQWGQKRIPRSESPTLWTLQVRSRQLRVE